MEARELRIGNLFNPCDTKSGVCVPNSSIVWRVGMIDKFGKIAVIEPEQHDTIYLTINECSPIPLTEDWLLKFGFVEKAKFFYKEGFCIGYLTTEDNLQIEYCIAGHGGWKVLELKYVHQLQNLYFFLTGEELKII